MRIGICALGALSQDTGGQTYIRNLWSHLQAASSPFEFVLFLSDQEGQELGVNLKPGFRTVSIPNTSSSVFRRLIGEHLLLRKYIRRESIDLMYYPNNFATIGCPVPYVLAIRSMLYYHHPYAVDWVRRWFRKSMTPPSARRARYIICPSDDIRRDVIRFIGVPADRVRVVNHGVDVSLFQQEDAASRTDEVLKTLGIQLPFMMYVSALWEYKNQDKLILAFHRLVKEGLPHRLLLVGKGLNASQAYEQKLQTMIKQLGLQDRVVLPGFLPHSVLRYLYRACDVFLFPSSYESFGNPLFEAMASDVPIVAANVHSFPEMAGDAALLVDPDDISHLTESIRRAVSDQLLRQDLIQAGRRRVALFSWTKCTDETLATFNSALMNGHNT